MLYSWLNLKHLYTEKDLVVCSAVCSLVTKIDPSREQVNDTKSANSNEGFTVTFFLYVCHLCTPYWQSLKFLPSVTIHFYNRL
jgi:hypothetical protein